MKEILFQYGLEEEKFMVLPFGNGLINTTWVIEDASGKEKFILQKINELVFKQPEDIAFNTRLVADYLFTHFPDYTFIYPLKTITGNDLVKTEDGYYRMIPFVQGSHTVDVVEKPEQAYEAAKQFGRFSKLLSDFDATQLKTTLPDFHNLTLRYQQFETACGNAYQNRIKQAGTYMSLIQQNKHIVETFEKLKPELKLRVMHHDTKISNVLFDKDERGICVIDLDTVMPGYFISDVGDMIRTYLCPVSEEESDFSKIMIRKDFYDAIVQGYLCEMGEELSTIEKNYFKYAGEFMIYMQAIRFLTDYLMGDLYYGEKYPGQNLVRAGNQLSLLQQLQAFNPGQAQSFQQPGALL